MTGATTPARYVTPATLASGDDEELSRVVLGRRALLFVRAEGGVLALVIAELDSDENVVAVRGVTRIPTRRLAELDAAFVTARKAIEGTAAA